tara:strand:- start:47 stop:499 length:453 start_codon:yes stop_codon:yes gene_type:complete
MASTTYNSDNVQAVFGTDATLNTRVVGAAFDARDNAADLKIASYTFTGTAKTADGTPDVVQLAVLPEGAKVYKVTLRADTALMAASGTVTISIGGNDIGGAITINNAAVNSDTGGLISPVSGNGVVSLTYSNHNVNAVAAGGEIHYAVDG